MPYNLGGSASRLLLKIIAALNWFGAVCWFVVGALVPPNIFTFKCMRAQFNFIYIS